MQSAKRFTGYRKSVCPSVRLSVFMYVVLTALRGQYTDSDRAYIDRHAFADLLKF